MAGGIVRRTFLHTLVTPLAGRSVLDRYWLLGDVRFVGRRSLDIGGAPGAAGMVRPSVGARAGRMPANQVRARRTAIVN